ncbi:Hypothetical protein PBC10988_31190 [Planctomycetales bacterium 10988]|nr:Hypothetical protein PBC10988_31190 [Planctomycetales bacterium 10988]
MSEPMPLKQVLQELAHNSSYLRQRAVKTLAERSAEKDRWTQEERDQALTALEITLNDKNKYVRLTAAQAMARLDPSRNEPAQVLGELLADSHRDVRASAAIALGGLGASAKNAIPILKTSLNDPVESVRKRVMEALDELGIDYSGS